MLKTGAPAPELTVPLAEGGSWRLKDQSPEAFTLLVFYRGYHCPICKAQLEEMSRRRSEFARAGLSPFCVSMDSPERIGRTTEEWDIGGLIVGHGLTAEQARQWGLFLSKGEKEGEPALFSEPGMALIRPDCTLYAAWVQSVPFARPGLDDLLSGVKFVTENDYPVRGTAA